MKGTGEWLFIPKAQLPLGPKRDSSPSCSCIARYELRQSSRSFLIAGPTRSCRPLVSHRFKGYRVIGSSCSMKFSQQEQVNACVFGDGLCVTAESIPPPSLQPLKTPAIADGVEFVRFGWI